MGSNPMKTGKQENRKAGKQESRKAGKQENRKTGGRNNTLPIKLQILRRIIVRIILYDFLRFNYLHTIYNQACKK